MILAAIGEGRRALDSDQVELAAKISVRVTEWTKNKDSGEFEPSPSLVETTVGRALMSEILPKGLPFSHMNKALKKKEISKLINADRKSTRLNSSHQIISYAVFCLKKKKKISNKT